VLRAGLQGQHLISDADVERVGLNPGQIRDDRQDVLRFKDFVFA
jgi:hypothetical protein